MSDLLQLENVSAGYGDAVILEDISFNLKAGDSLALLGRNGMGKTTLLATLVGATRLRRGRILYEGQDIAQMPSHLRAQAGLGWVPQERDIFKSLTVQENLTVVARPGEWNLERVYGLFPRLKERRGNLGNQLSGGEQQMLAMGRALMLNPKILLLDEPLEGLAPLIAQELLNITSQMVASGNMAVILVEQHARQILKITHRAIVLERGRIVYTGASADLLADGARLDAWLSAGGGQPAAMPAPARAPIPALEAIHNEHRAIAAVLKAMSFVVDGIEAGRLEPDFTLLASMIEYIAELPDKKHHPKENMIFALLRSKTREVDRYLDKLETDHRDVDQWTGTLDRALVRYMQGGAAEFPTFRDAARGYVTDEWEHLNMEESRVFPMARRLFSAEEWVEINAAFARNDDPWSGPDNRFELLFRQITQLTPAPMGVGGDAPPAN